MSERTDADHTVTGVYDEVANLILRFLVQRRIPNDPAVRDFRRLEFKLRLDQRQDHTVGSYQVEGVRQDQSQRDEGNIDDAQVDLLRNVFAAEIAGVQFLTNDHARIVPDFPGQLPMAHVYRVNFCRASLEQAIGEIRRWKRRDPAPSVLATGISK